jgi:hypothetical protein
MQLRCQSGTTGQIFEPDSGARGAAATPGNHGQNMRWRLAYKLKQYKGLNKIRRLAATPLQPVK